MSALSDALRGLPDPVFGDLLESETAYEVVLDLPGTTAETVEATVAGGRLTIRAERRKDVSPEFTYVNEDRSLFLDVTLPLPPDAAGTGAEAQLDRGVLRVRLPKRSASAAASIPVEGT